MPRAGEKNTGGHIWHPSPYQSAPMHTGSIQGVWLKPGERVFWNWAHGPSGSYVSGYIVNGAPRVKIFGETEDEA